MRVALRIAETMIIAALIAGFIWVAYDQLASGLL